MFIFICFFFQITTFAQTWSWVQQGNNIDGEGKMSQSGCSISMSDKNTIAIGARVNSGNAPVSGQARVYQWKSNQWHEQGNIYGEATNDWAGWSVSMPFANTIAIGAVQSRNNGVRPGRVRIFRWNGKQWKQKGTDINGEADGDWAGHSIIMPDSNTVAIGAIFNKGTGNSAGHVRIYSWSGSAWVQKGADIDGEAANDQSGYSVSMPDANTVAIGAPSNSGTATSAGHVGIYSWSGSAWVQKGADIDGEAADDFSGFSVSMPDSNTVAIGAPGNSANGLDAGHVRIYEWNGSVWIQKGADIDGEADDQSGWSVCLTHDNHIAIGAPKNVANGTNTGHVRIYKRENSSWVQKGADIDGELSFEKFGYSVDMPDSNTFIAGAPLNDGKATDAGHVRIYSWSGSAWTEKGADIDGEATGDQSGYSVSMPDASTVAIGAPYNDGTATNAGHVRIYTWSGSTWVQKGTDIDGVANSDKFGYSISMPDSNTIAISAPYDGIKVSNAGYVRILTWNGSRWAQKGNVIDGKTDGASYFVSMPDANTLAISGPGVAVKGLNTGQVKVYNWNGIKWIQKGGDINGKAANSFLGFSLSMPDSNTVATGSPVNNGEVRILKWDGNTWKQKGIDIVGEGGNFGFSASMSDSNTIAIGAPDYNSNKTVNFSSQKGQVRIYKICKNSTETIARTACYSYVSPSKKYTYTKSDTYYDTIPNANGCDSVIIINITIDSADVSVANSSPTLTANATGATYQWLNCDSNFAKIDSANKRIFFATSNGNYAVEVTQNGCIDTSLCINVSNAHILENTFGNYLKVFPNPTKDEVNIELGNHYNEVSVIVRNALGQEVMRTTFNKTNAFKLNIAGETGFYILELHVPEHKALLRVLKN